MSAFKVYATEVSEADKELWGITDDLIRVSVGVEDETDIITAFGSALDHFLVLASFARKTAKSMI